MTRIRYSIALVLLCIIVTLPQSIFAPPPDIMMPPIDATSAQQPESFNPSNSMPGMPGMPPMSEAEFLQMQQELDREIDRQATGRDQALSFEA